MRPSEDMIELFVFQRKLFLFHFCNIMVEKGGITLPPFDDTPNCHAIQKKFLIDTLEHVLTIAPKEYDGKYRYNFNLSDLQSEMVNAQLVTPDDQSAYPKIITFLKTGNCAYEKVHIEHKREGHAITISYTISTE